MNYLVARLKEKSTYSGLLALLSALGLAVDPEQFSAIAAAVMALFYSAVGMRTVGRADIFDMVFHPAITPPQAGHCPVKRSEKECKKSELLALLYIEQIAIYLNKKSNCSPPGNVP
jgi:hypothetical protein